MKKLRVILPAILTLAVSTSAAVTGTVAWFVGRNIVNVTGINMQARGEDGIVIAQETAATKTAANWKTNVTALHTGANKAFIPATTKALNVTSGWQHANAVDANTPTTGATYENFTITAATIGTADSVATGTTPTQVISAKNVYLYNEFYIQAAAKQDLDAKLYVKSLTCTESDTAQDINKTLRIAFKIGSEVKVYCPLRENDFTATEYSYGAAYQCQSGSGYNSDDDIYTAAEIPAYTDAGTNALKLEVFCWFEGEDENCKTANLEETFNNITIDFSIGNEEN